MGVRRAARGACDEQRFRKAPAETPGGAVCSDSCMWRGIGVGVGYGGLRYCVALNNNLSSLYAGFIAPFMLVLHAMALFLALY